MKVLVIGGGVIGAACAYYVQRAGHEVTVIDRSEFGRGCSHGNCGIVCPSHVLPLAEPGAVGMALRSLLKKNSPFRIAPRLDVRLASWLVRFALRCNRADMIASGRACHALLEFSRKQYDELLRDERLDCEWERRGLLFVYETEAALDQYARTDRLLTDEFGVCTQRLDSEALTAMEPALKPGLAGGFFYNHDAHLRPDRLLRALHDLLVARGVAIRERCEVRGFAVEGSSARAVVTQDGEIVADQFVIATGAWTPQLARALGCAIPIQPGKGYSITMPRPALCPQIPMLLMERRVGVTPFASGYRLGSTMEFAGYDDSIRRERLELLRDGARACLREPYCEPVEEEWCGWRPMTYDSLPIVDFSPRMKNVLIAAGHNTLGVTMAPGTGKLVAELLSGVAPSVDLEPFAVTRF